MKEYKFYFAIILVCMISSCSDKPKEIANANCVINITQLLKKDSSRLEINDQTKGGIITQLVDKTKDSVITGSYYFYLDGSLKSYKFFGLPSTYQYNEEYDSLGNIILIEGSPIVFHFYRQIDNSIVQFTFLFSTLHKEYKYVNIRTNAGVQFPAELLDNTTFTNMKSVTFDLPVAKTFKNTIIYTDCQLFNTCLNKQWALKDTAIFKDKSL